MNTRSKRASSVGIGLIWLLAPIAPDGTLDQGDRQHAAISYSGILAAPAVPVQGPGIIEGGAGSGVRTIEGAGAGVQIVTGVGASVRTIDGGAGAAQGTT